VIVSRWSAGLAGWAEFLAAAVLQAGHGGHAPAFEENVNLSKGYIDFNQRDLLSRN
jgi:hypothetical protein